MTCATGKRRFDGQGAARHALRAFQHRHKQRLRVYKCPTCHGWHFTSLVSG